MVGLNKSGSASQLWRLFHLPPWVCQDILFAQGLGLVPGKAAASDYRWSSHACSLGCPMMARMSPPLRAFNEGLLIPSTSL